MLTFQCVTKSAKKIYHSSSKSIKLYVASLLLSAGKKNCTSMSSSCSVSYNAMQIVFVVSNMKNLTPKQHILAYEYRWTIEKFFRTAKQHLGIQDCQSTSIKKQRAHIFATFLAFIELEVQKIYKKKKSPEQVLKVIRDQNRLQKNPPPPLLEGLIM
jgi:transposase